MSKVAILQNQFRLSGRTHVMCEMIAVLNKRGIEPDILSFTPHDLASNIGTYFDLPDLRYQTKRIAPVPFHRGAQWQVLASNLLTRSQHTSYDFIINSNDTLYALNEKARYFHYIHYPGTRPGLYLERYPNPNSIRGLYGRLVTRLITMSGEALIPEQVYVNSEFTAEATRRVYKDRSIKIEVLPPPAFVEMNSTNSAREPFCLSIGSIIPDKHQLKQLEIATQVPELQFVIVGSVRDELYYRKLLNLREERQLTNVTIETDVPHERLEDLLGRASFFVHTMRFEPFGISTAKAIAAGCLPIVTDSGGQREIVPDPALRFDDIDGAVQIFKRLLATSTSELEQQQKNLQAHNANLSRANFQKRMEPLLSDMLKQGE